MKRTIGAISRHVSINENRSPVSRNLDYLPISRSLQKRDRARASERASQDHRVLLSRRRRRARNAHVSPIKRRAVHYQYGGESRGGAEFTRVRGIRAETQHPTGPERLYSATVRGPTRKPDLLPAGVLPEAGKGT